MIRVPILLAALLPLTGACTTVYHLETAIPPENVVTDDRLLGAWTWEDEGDDLDSLRFEPGPGSDYTLVPYADWGGDEAPPDLRARLGTIGPHTVLELWPASGDMDDDWLAGQRLLFVVEFGEELLTLRFPDWSALVAVVEADAWVTLDREVDDIVLAEPTPRLFALYAEFLARPDALSDPADSSVLRRIRGVPDP
jgi:hypothetical protein